MMLELAAKNQMKNLILGTDLPTLTDVGGIGGIWDRLTGKAGPLQAQAMQAGAMSVTTPMVTLNATSIAGLGSMSFAQAGIGAAPGALGGSVDVQQQVWDFFARKNLKPHQIAGIMGNISAESGFNPLNVGDYGKAHGLFQWNDRAPKLFDFIGGQGNLGNVQAQLEFAWQELLTSENGPLKRLLAAPDLYSATHAFTGFERPSGYDAANPSSAAGWSQRLAGAEAALARFGATTSSATDGLSTFGTGLDSFGRDLFGGLQGLFGGGQGGAGGGGGFWSTFGTMIAGAFGIPGFAVGGTAPDGIIAVSNGEFYVPGAVAGPNMAALEAINAGRPAAAGMISGPGTGTSDSIMMPARAGDFIVNAAATARNRPLLEAMIAGRPMQRLASGGQVLSRSPIQMPAVAAAAADHTSHMTSDTRPVIQIMNNSSARVEAEVEETTDASGRRAWRLMMADAVGDALQTPGGGAKKKLASMGVRPRSALR
ncbi:MAG: phage tail tip lysozyme [Pseudodonghicola sp.]